jgi:hypothetical protein
MTRLGVVVSVLLVAATVRAQEGEEPPAPPPTGTGMPLPYAQRPLTLTQQTLRADASLEIEHFEDVFDPFDGSVTSPELEVLAAVGAAFGLHDDFEVGGVAFPILFSPSFRYANPSVYATFRFLRGRGELGANLRVTFPVRPNTDAVIDPGLVFLLHAGESARLDAGVRFPIAVTGEDPLVSLVVPLAFAFNFTESLYAGVESGFTVPRFNTELWLVPFHGFVGYAIPGSDGGPLVDVEARFGWPELFTPGLEGDQTQGGHYLFVLAGRVYIGLR